MADLHRLMVYSLLSVELYTFATVLKHFLSTLQTTNCWRPLIYQRREFNLLAVFIRWQHDLLVLNYSETITKWPPSIFFYRVFVLLKGRRQISLRWRFPRSGICRLQGFDKWKQFSEVSER